MQDFLDVSKIPAKGAITGILGATTIVAGIAAFNPQLAGIIFFGMLIVALATAKFIWIRSLIRKRRAKSMSGELNQQSAAAPAGVSDVSKRAKLDQLRQKFGEGLAKFGNAQNIYKFPWYVIVGEPGSGKTEAIRHSNVGFPPGMQDDLQGAGGTINMNWWFTNQAVFLDTAGKLMFEEVKPGESNEWKEFLQLLVRNRPNCPINGLLLIIPTDALIKDTDAELNRKAGRIAAQFELIQRTLDIRFPVFVMITKCDMMSGFREFFDDFADAQSVNQMLGWSNPEERDAPFQPERVTDHLASVVQRIKKRRLSLLRDPVPQKGHERRTDEVDALYSLPQSIQLLAPRLRQYLEQIFVAGPWAPKPLFLRGIYFTSSMREGAALDQELAQALGLGADQLSEAKVWEKERAYFLRDIFTEKVFRERGLVTRATDTKKLLRKRGLIVWGTASLLALTFIGITVYAYRQFADSIEQHSKLWGAAKVPNDWKDGRWKPIVSPEKPGATLARFRGTEPPVRVGNTDIPLLSFHDQLKANAVKKLEVGWVYRPVMKLENLDGKRIHAQQIVYEGSVIYPLVQSARFRMQNEAIESADGIQENPDVNLKREMRALAALLRIEADKVTGESKIAELPDAVLLPLLQYVTATVEPVPADKWKLLSDTFTATYTDNSNARWVPKRLSAGYASLSENQPIAAGIARLKKLSAGTVAGQIQSAKRVLDLYEALRKFIEIEGRMSKSVTGTDSDATKKAIINIFDDELTPAKDNLDDKLNKVLNDNLLAGEKISLVAWRKKLVDAGSAVSTDNFKLLRDFLQPLLKNEKVAKEKANLFENVDKELENEQKANAMHVEATFQSVELPDLKRLDNYLENFSDDPEHRRIYTVRFDTYKKAAGWAGSKQEIFKNLIGNHWDTWKKAEDQFKLYQENLKKTQRDLVKDSGGASYPDVTEAAGALLEIARRNSLSAIAYGYLRETKDEFDANFFAQMVSGSGKNMTPEQERRANLLIQAWTGDDSGLPQVEQIEPKVGGTLKSFIGKLDKMNKAASAYKEWEKRKAGMRANVTFVSQDPLKWKTANGKDIFYINPGQSVDLGAVRTVELIDTVNAPREASVPIDRSGRISRFGVSFNVELVDENGNRTNVPPAPEQGPSKPDIMVELKNGLQNAPQMEPPPSGLPSSIPAINPKSSPSQNQKPKTGGSTPKPPVRKPR